MKHIFSVYIISTTFIVYFLLVHIKYVLYNYINNVGNAIKKLF